MGRSLVGFLVSGLFVGAVARLLVGSSRSLGCLGTNLLGVVGAFAGGLLSRVIWGARATPGIVMSIVGAALVMVVLNWFDDRHR